MDNNREIIASVIGNGHSFTSHKAEFGDPTLGREIDINDESGLASPSGLVRYINEALQSDATRVFTADGNKSRNGLPTSYIYNGQDNTLLILDANNSQDFGTIYRPNAGHFKFERLRENAGSPPVRKGVKAVQSALDVFEHAIFEEAIVNRNIDSLRRLVQEAQKLQLTVSKPKAFREEQQQAEKENDTAETQNAEAPEEKNNAPENPEDYIHPEIADILSDTENTMGFWADKDARVTHYLNEKQMAVATISPAGQSVHSFNAVKKAYAFFERKMEESARVRGEDPDVVEGGHAGLSAQYKLATGKPPRVGGDLPDIGKQLKRAARHGCSVHFNKSVHPAETQDVTFAQPLSPAFMPLVRHRLLMDRQEYINHSIMPI